ncbi:MAG: sigma-70 family RNA polymerase sigma factor [Pyrinomonadaceae bacterium]
MSLIAEKHKNTVAEAIEHLISRAENTRSLTGSDIAGRVEKTIVKYLLGPDPDATNQDIRTFVEEIRSDDLCLIIACERGDEQAWDDLVTNFDFNVKSAARKISSNNDDADDLASSIWAELYGLRTDAEGNKKSKLAYYSGRGSLAGWLRAVVSQLAIDQYRKQAKLVQIEEDRQFEIVAHDAAETKDNRFGTTPENPEELFTESRTSADVSAALTTAIAELDPEDRLILKLYYFDELRLKDLAAIFGYHEATASRKLTRLQTEIRKRVEKGLRERHGWTESEVKRHLSETATSLGVNLETMFAILLIAACVQEVWI